MVVLSHQNERSTKLCVSLIVNSEKIRQLLSLSTVVYKCLGFDKIGRKLYVMAYTFSNTRQKIFFQLKEKCCVWCGKGILSSEIKIQIAELRSIFLCLGDSLPARQWMGCVQQLSLVFLLRHIIYVEKTVTKVTHSWVSTARSPHRSLEGDRTCSKGKGSQET